MVLWRLALSPGRAGVGRMRMRQEAVGVSLERVLAALTEHRGDGRWSEDEMYGLVFDDAVVIVGMDKDRNMRVDVALGDPIQVKEKWGGGGRSE